VTRSSIAAWIKPRPNRNDIWLLLLLVVSYKLHVVFLQRICLEEDEKSSENIVGWSQDVRTTKKTTSHIPPLLISMTHGHISMCLYKWW
jgi:hypothetical protein